MENDINPDTLQQAWQVHSSQTRLKIDPDMLLKQLDVSHRAFEALIYWRDFREVFTAVVMIPVWLYLGITLNPPWTWYLTIPALVWVAGYMLVGRLQSQKKHPKTSDQTLLQNVTTLLYEVERQIWLLKNISWWYLLPFTISVSAFFFDVFLRGLIKSPPQTWPDMFDAVFGIGMVFLFVFAVYWFIHYLNQLAVRTQLEPQRQELLSLLSGLNEESAPEAIQDFPILMSAKESPLSRRHYLISSLISIAISLSILWGVVYMTTSQSHSSAPNERSPFTAVRWVESQPQVRVDDEWYRLISLNGIPASEIVEFSQNTNEELWKKRFEEDLVALLTQMGHPPQETVTLEVESILPRERRTLENVPMTRANRQQIYSENLGLRKKK